MIFELFKIGPNGWAISKIYPNKYSYLIIWFYSRKNFHGIFPPNPTFCTIHLPPLVEQAKTQFVYRNIQSHSLFFLLLIQFVKCKEQDKSVIDLTFVPILFAS